MKRLLTLLALLTALTLAVAACGDDDSDAGDDAATEETSSTTDGTDEADEADDAADDFSESDADTEPADDAATASESGEFPVTISTDAGEVTLEAAPQRIVSLSPSATEILFAIGAGDQVVAVDDFSYYPPEAPVTDLSAFDPNIEAITNFEPDLVVMSYDANDVVAGLGELGIPVVLDSAPVDIESGYDNVAMLGVATGQIDGAAATVATMREEIAAAFEAAPQVDARIYHELDQTYFSASSATFIGSVYAEMGLTNIADEADTDGSGYPQLTEEYIVEADPQIIVITDQGGYGPADVAVRPGWETISAVVNNNIISVDADIASRWGPRLPQFITAVATALDGVSASS